MVLTLYTENTSACKSYVVDTFFKLALNFKLLWWVWVLVRVMVLVIAMIMVLTLYTEITSTCKSSVDIYF